MKIQSSLPKVDKVQKLAVSGYTLLELLVVIGIIALLVTIGLPSFSTAQKKSRDSKRKSDIAEIQQALEQYYSVCGYSYPTIAAGSFYTSINCPTPPISIMPAVQTDPRGLTPYYCPTPNCTSTGYTICAGLEAETPNTVCRNNQQ